MVKPLPAGVRLTAIFDSCHSGSVLDLPYLYSTKGVLKEPNLAKEAGQGFLEAAGHYARGDVSSALGSVFSFAKTAFKGNDAYEQTKRTKTSPADVVMWSGCKDEQTSADATIASQATGAMSHAFIDALSKKPQQSYVELLNNIRDFLQAKYSQKPQLSCSHPLGGFSLTVTCNVYADRVHFVFARHRSSVRHVISCLERCCESRRILGLLFWFWIVMCGSCIRWLMSSNLTFLWLPE